MLGTWDRVFQFVLSAVALYARYGAIQHMYNLNLAVFAIKFKGVAVMKLLPQSDLVPGNIKARVLCFYPCGVLVRIRIQKPMSL